MALLPATNDSATITTTPTDIDSVGYCYHHIKIFFTSTIQTGDVYRIQYFGYDPVAVDWVFHDEDTVDIDSTRDAAGTAGMKKCWEINPTPGDGLRVRVFKVSGLNGTINYQIIQAQ
jgi:hypothetical protein